MENLNNQDTPGVNYEDLVHQQKSLDEREKAFEEQAWTDSNVHKFDDLLRMNYNKSLEEFSQIVLDYICELTGAFSGIIYNHDRDREKLIALAGYACVIEQLSQAQFELGESPIGQAADSQTELYFENISSERIELKMSSVQVNISNIYIIPLVFNDFTYGVLELIYITPVNPRYKLLLAKISRNIAIMMESISNNTLTKKLLADSQESTERLRAQEEELRQNLEELATTQEAMEDHKKALESKESELQKVIKEMQVNEEDMQRSEEKLRSVILNFQKQTHELKEKDSLIDELKKEIDLLRKN